jgi:hypothetical protein
MVVSWGRRFIISKGKTQLLSDCCETVDAQEQGNGLEFYEMVELINGYLTPELPYC